MADARRRFADNWLIVFLEGRYLIDHDRWEEALVVFRSLLAVDVSVLPDKGPAYHARIFGALSHDACGVCLFRLGRHAEAAEAWAKAAACAPDDPEFAIKGQLAQARGGAAARVLRR